MQKKHLFAAIILITLVVSIAGCLQEEQPQPPSPIKEYTYGLFITDFSALSSIDSGEALDVSLAFQNIGDSTAENIIANLYQKADFIFLNDVPEKNIVNLYPPDRELGLEGESIPVFWALTAPTVPRTQSKSLKARITYDYESTASTNIYLVSKQEYDESGAEAFKTYSTTSVGPLSLVVSPLPAYRIAPTTTSQTVHLSIIFRNTGTGTVDGNVWEFNVTLKRGTEVIDINEIRDCDGVTNNNGEAEVKLFGPEQERSVRCTFDLEYPGNASSYIAEISAEYTYYLDTPALNVQVREAEPIAQVSEIVSWEYGNSYDFDSMVLCTLDCAGVGDIRFSGRDDEPADLILPQPGAQIHNARANSGVVCSDVNEGLYLSTGGFLVRPNEIVCVKTDRGRVIRINYLSANPNSRFEWTEE